MSAPTPEELLLLSSERLLRAQHALLPPWGERALHVGELGRWPDVREVWEAFDKLKGDCR